MNKTTVKRLEEIAETIKGLKNELDSFSEEENRKYNNIPGNLQKSQNGRKPSKTSTSSKMPLDTSMKHWKTSTKSLYG